MQIQLPGEPQRILIVKPSALGDVVHALPILNLLRLRWPKAHIAWLVMPAFAGLLEGHPQLDRVIPFERRQLAKAWKDPGRLGELFRLTRDLREARFDLVIDLQGLLRSGWLTSRTRAPVRVGFANAREGAPLFYTHRVPVRSKEVHAIERYLSVAEALGCGRQPVRFIFPTDDTDRAAVAEMLGGIDRYAVLLPGTNWATKRWPVEHFAETARKVRERMGLGIVVAGGADVTGLAARIPFDANLAAGTSIRQLVALLERAELVIANDSGPMHIAAALGRPLVTLFGPTNPIRTGPYNRPDTVARVDIPCSPCYSRRCSHTSCMRWLTPESVLSIAGVQLRARKP